MANLYTGTHTFTGYKTLAELTELTFTADTKYMIQITAINSNYYVREGEEGEGFEKYDAEPFEWKYDGENDLYLSCAFSKSLKINVAG